MFRRAGKPALPVLSAKIFVTNLLNEKAHETRNSQNDSSDGRQHPHGHSHLARHSELPIKSGGTKKKEGVCVGFLLPRTYPLSIYEQHKSASQCPGTPLLSSNSTLCTDKWCFIRVLRVLCSKYSYYDKCLVVRIPYVRYIK